ncbi:unnamed protein product [Medioppia subpectinata]|uniref:Uncharacterized protein n=1 Tax=Medioppia subpectinata TaxID=1979941 RepID=A0A7R9KPT8_9ACAR|nr:unnamed protein product [Medioppia subpectinata]CAG2106303.1 unnamed protein product [Medioppia subpectinata]
MLKLETKHKEYYGKIEEIVTNCTNGLIANRPSCMEILECRSNWAPVYESVRVDIGMMGIDSSVNYDHDKNFVEYFLAVKRNANDCAEKSANDAKNKMELELDFSVSTN